VSTGDHTDDVIIVTAPLAQTIITEAQPSTIGVKGDKGDRGDKGEAGADGRDGLPGADGRDGKDGLNGVDGSDGAKGADGIVGRDGVDGVDGTPGKDGADGKDGAPGVKGEQGDRGLTGEKGDAGIQGLTGLPGLKGEPGIDGVGGAKGDPGDDGARGPKGDLGDTGAKGNPGGVGPKGDKGEPGSDGLQGVKGDTGDTGQKGDQGIQGIQGVKGDAGVKGDTGAATNGLPTGGTTNQILAKTAATDYAAAWQTKTFLATAGTGREVQYRNGAALAAASKVSINADGNLLLNADAVVRQALISNRTFLSVGDIYSTGSEFPLGVSPGFSSQRHWMAHGDNTSVATKAWDGATVGTPTTVLMSPSATLAEPQLSYETAAAAGSAAGMVCTNPVIKSSTTGVGGFFATLRLRVPNLVAGQRWFVGLSADANAPIDQEPTVQTNFIGFGVGAADTNIQYITRVAGAVTKNDMNMPAAIGGSFYTFMFYNPPGITNITANFRNGTYNMGGSSISLPDGRYFLKSWISTAATTTKAAISYSRGYIEHLYSVY